jgi:hypothetical protein
MLAKKLINEYVSALMEKRQSAHAGPWRRYG